MDKNPYEILGVAPDASQRQIGQAFIALSERHRREMLSDPTGCRAFDETDAAYHLLASPAARRLYNEKHGLPRPRSSQGRDGQGLLETTGNMLPDGWPWWLAALSLPILYFGSWWVLFGAPYFGVPYFHSWGGLIAYLSIGAMLSLVVRILLSDR